MFEPIAIIFGLLCATLLAHVVVPVIHALFFGLKYNTQASDFA